MSAAAGLVDGFKDLLNKVDAFKEDWKNIVRQNNISLSTGQIKAIDKEIASLKNRIKQWVILDTLSRKVDTNPRNLARYQSEVGPSMDMLLNKIILISFLSQLTSSTSFESFAGHAIRLIIKICPGWSRSNVCCSLRPILHTFDDDAFRRLQKSRYYQSFVLKTINKFQVFRMSLLCGT